MHPDSQFRARYYRVVQLDFTQEIEVLFSMIYYIKKHFEFFNFQG